MPDYLVPFLQFCEKSMNSYLKNGTDWRVLDALLVSLGYLSDAMIAHKDLHA
jgi:hypothetical protein